MESCKLRRPEAEQNRIMIIDSKFEIDVTENSDVLSVN